MPRSLSLLLRGLAWCIAVLALLAFLILSGFRIAAALRERLETSQAAPTTGRFVRAGDIDLYYEERGDPRAPAVVFIHGFGAWSGTWESAMRAVSDAGYHAVALDIPPFGFSQRPSPDGYGTARQGERIVAAIRALHLTGAVLVGHSFGGRATMEAAMLDPGNTRALALLDVALDIDPAPLAPSPGMRAFFAVRPVRDALLSATVTNPLFTRTLLSSFMAKTGALTPERVDIYREPGRHAGTTRAIGDWLVAISLSPDSAFASRSQSYEAVRVPTLIVWGDADTVTPLPQGERLAALIPGARLEILPGIGHLPHVEDAASTERLLIEFLKTEVPSLVQ